MIVEKECCKITLFFQCDLEIIDTLDTRNLSLTLLQYCELLEVKALQQIFFLCSAHTWLARSDAFFLSCFPGPNSIFLRGRFRLVLWEGWFTQTFVFTLFNFLHYWIIVIDSVLPFDLLLGLCCKQVLCPQRYLPLPGWGFWGLWYWASRG